MRQLNALGVLDRVEKTGAPQLTSLCVDYDQGTLNLPIRNEFGYTLSVRRTALDPILADEARLSGAEVRFQAEMRDLVWDDGRVVGVTIDGTDATAEEHRARLVVGADGRHSPIAQKVGAKSYDEVASPTSAIYAYLEGVGPIDAGNEALHFASGPGADSIIGPSDGGVACVLLILGNEDFERSRSNATNAFQAGMRTIPAAARRLENARMVGKVRTVKQREVDGRFRVPHGVGWALVGDAGCKQHPAAGLGIGEAMRGAELLHATVEEAWSQGLDANATLPDYQAIRDAEFKPRYDLSFSMASLNPFDNGGLARVMEIITRANVQPARV